MRAMKQSTNFDYRFWGAHNVNNSIKAFPGDEFVKVNPISCEIFPRVVRFRGYWKAISERGVQAVVIHGAPNWPDTWLMAIAARLFGKRVAFWSHGWLKSERPIKRVIRNIYFGLANIVMVYGARSKRLAAISGFPEERVVPIVNSLDTAASETVYQNLAIEGAFSVRQRLGVPVDSVLLVCVARLTAACSFHLVIDALETIKITRGPVTFALIGDGPERGNLERIAKEQGHDVRFLGEMYDEATIGSWIYAADLCVSPGKIGLSAMHALAYGTPAITHDDYDCQMPEFEAIEEGVSGSFFERDSVESLSQCICNWLDRSADRQLVRDRCRSVIFDRYTPDRQLEMIDSALSAIIRDQS
jgi:glycosyltransferase involved in cell wall biosynthesis